MPRRWAARPTAGAAGVEARGGGGPRRQVRTAPQRHRPDPTPPPPPSRTPVRQRSRTEEPGTGQGHGQTETQGYVRTGKTSKAWAGPPPPPPTPLTCHDMTFFRTIKIQLKPAQHARVSGHAKRKTMCCVPAGRRGA
jgi:hypothetical protein